MPTLGYIIGQQIEELCVIPDGPQRGQPFLLTDEMWKHCIHAYRLNPRARVHPKYPRPYDGMVHRGRQLRRSQKWGKDPLMAACCAIHALGETQFDGWDADGEPVARPVPTPWIQLAATSIDQVANTFRPLVRMLREGPLADTPGLDVGDTRIKLPNGDGWIEPVTAASDSRLGAPITWLGITEPHLMRHGNGGLALAHRVDRDLRLLPTLELVERRVERVVPQELSEQYDCAAAREQRGPGPAASPHPLQVRLQPGRDVQRIPRPRRG